MIKLGSELSYKDLWLFSLPSIVSSLLEPLASIVDTALVGNISTPWLAALAVATTITSTFTWMFNFLIHTPTSEISKATVTDQEYPGELARQVKVGVSACLIVGFVSALLLYLVRQLLYPLAGSRVEIEAFIEQYFVIRLIGHPFTLFYLTLLSILRGLGKVYLSLIFVFFATFLNIFFSWLFLYHWHWGLEGVAWGTVFSHVLGCSFCLFYIVSDERIKPYLLKLQKIKANFFHFGKNSLNLFGRSLTLSICFFLSTKLASTLGLASLGAHQVLLKFWLFSSFFIDGLAITANILLARTLVEKNINRLKIICERLLYMAGAIGFLFAVIYFFAGNILWSFFTNDPNVVLVIVSIWSLVAISQLPISMAYIYDGFMLGLQEFTFMRKQMILGTIICFLPVALVGTFFFKALWGVWIGLILLGVYRAVVSFNRLKVIEREWI